ncbi:lipopolysaccharide biosynthesis protein [Oenococcus sp.]|uniref:lipopolysaccharide biosynthesis protein n=1 Tax=Oenococcus sp. TaxID=1979414 RepID=UPI0039E8EC53
MIDDSKLVNRTKAAYVNSVIAAIAQFANLIFSFVTRFFFIHELGREYLGLNGLFLNILNILSFAELGIGAAITFSLYKPIHDQNHHDILALMRLFRTVYRIIALIILVCGLVILPFLPNFIADKNLNASVGNVYFAFFLALMNTVVSYLLSYKRSFVIAAQLGYLDSVNRLSFNVITQVFQIFFLLTLHSFYIYLFIQLLLTFLSNVRITMIANKRFPYLKDLSKAGKVSKDVVDYLKKNVIGMMSAKFGGVVVNGTDNLILSSFIGLSIVGLYSNYTLFLTGLASVLTQGISAVTSSIGNLGSEAGSLGRQKKIFHQYQYINNLVSAFGSFGLALFLPDAISLWAGKSYLLSALVTFLIVENFFITQLRQNVINVTNAYGLYWFERYKSIIEALSNLIISLVLVVVFKFGIEGVLLGTIASNIFVNSWWEPMIIFQNKLHGIWRKYTGNYLVMLLLGTLLLALQIFSINAQFDKVGVLEILFKIIWFILSMLVVLAIMSWEAKISPMKLMRERIK